MADASSWMMFAAVAIPLLVSITIALSKERFAEIWTYLAAVSTFICVVSIAPGVLGGSSTQVSLLELLPGLSIALSADVLGLTFALLASTLWIVTSCYSSAYVRVTKLAHRRRYFACFAASIGAVNLIAFSANVLVMIVGFELLTVATYPLVAHDETTKAIASARRYLAYALSGGLLLTVAAVWTWRLSGTLDFRPGGFLGTGITAGWALFLLYFAGAGVKAAIMPLHGWLPEAMVAPTPVSALLHAVAVVKAGVFGCIRFIGFVFEKDALQSFSADRILITACGVTIIVASVLALKEDHLKRRLAYSTIASLSTIVLGAAMLSPHGLEGALLYFVNHALAKITLFFCAGALYAYGHKTLVSELQGVGREMPWTMGAFTVAALSLSGAPGLGVFIAKLTILRGAVEVDDFLALGILLMGSVLSAAYLFPIVRSAFFDSKVTHEADTAHDPGVLMRASFVATAIGTLVLGSLPFLVRAELQLASLFSLGVLGKTP